MSDTSSRNTSRRGFLKNTGRLAAASALLGTTLPHVHAAENNTIRVALIGCGGRGSGAAADALSIEKGPIQLVAMADVFADRMATSYKHLKDRFGDRMDVPEDRRFIGFDAYQKAMDCIQPGDVAIFATPPAFRWVHFGYAIQKGLNVFMEKPVTVDGPTTRRMLELGEQSLQKNLKVGVGLMWRHCRARQALHQRIKDGEIGDVLTLRAYRMHGPIGFFASPPKPDDISDLMYQTQRFHSFLWASGGCYSDFYIHNIDECCWMKGQWPINAQATGGRHFRGDSVDQNFDNYSVEYTFADGTKLFLYGRCIGGCFDQFSSLAHGSKCAATISVGAGVPAQCSIHKGQNMTRRDAAWQYEEKEVSPYRLEWEDLVDAIRQDQPYNEVKRGAEASLVTSMGRMAAHTGQLVTYDEIFNLEHEFAPTVDRLTDSSAAPLLAGPDGRYPVPQPGITTKHEY